MLVRVLLAALVVSATLVAPLASAAIIVHSTGSSSCCSGSSDDPDVYNLDDDGQFESFFFSPFDVGDLAWSNSGLLVGHEDSGTIARVDERGGLLGLISTGVNRIDGLAVDSTGDIFVAEDGSNRMFRLNSAGTFLDLRFMPLQIESLGVDSSNNLIFAERTGTSSSSTFDIVRWDYDNGVEVSRFSTNLRVVYGLTGLGDDILAVGRESSCCSSSPSQIFRFGASGALVDAINGPQNMGSIAAHAPEPGTALLMGLGLMGLSRTTRTRRAVN